MENKKGQRFVNVIVVLIILFVSGLIILSLSLVVGGAVVEGVGEVFCTFSTEIRGRATIVDIHFYPELCETGVADIKPTSEAGCPSTFAASADFSPEDCAKERVVNLAARCWSQRGRGGLNPGDFVCYYACMETHYSITDAEGNITHLSREQAEGLVGATEQSVFFTKEDLAQTLELDTESVAGRNITYSSVISSSDISFSSTAQSGRFIKFEFDDDTSDTPNDKVKITVLDNSC